MWLYLPRGHAKQGEAGELRTAQQWFDAYGVSHQNPVNKAIHWICVPVIVFSTIGLFWSIPHDYLPSAQSGSVIGPYVNFGTLLVVGSLVFYFRLGITIGIGMFVWSAFALWGNAVIEASVSYPLWQISTLVFIIAWIGQFIGHKIEGVKPSFFEDIQFLLVGPAWLLHFIYRRCGVPI